MKPEVVVGWDSFFEQWAVAVVIGQRYFTMPYHSKSYAIKVARSIAVSLGIEWRVEK